MIRGVARPRLQDHLNTLRKYVAGPGSRPEFPGEQILGANQWAAERRMLITSKAWKLPPGSGATWDIIILSRSTVQYTPVSWQTELCAVCYLSFLLPDWVEQAKAKLVPPFLIWGPISRFAFWTAWPLVGFLVPSQQPWRPAGEFPRAGPDPPGTTLQAQQVMPFGTL